MKKGVLLINLGTPESPSDRHVGKYLTQFLNDPRVFDISAIGRFFLVNFILIPFRTSKSAKLYQNVWTSEGSPLMVHSVNLKNKLQESLGNNYKVSLGMRYQNPSIELALEELRKEKPSEIIIISLYPQYASSSTGSSAQEAMKIISQWEVIPDLRFINKFYDHPGFIASHAEQGKMHDLNFYDHILFSYHGLPERHIHKGSNHYGSDYCQVGKCCDRLVKNNQYCYRANCYETTREIVKSLNIPAEKYSVSFQSRLGRDPWIRPYSDVVIEDLAKKGVKNLLVFSPAFVADCLETIYEIGKEYDEIFKKSGGEKLTLVDSLNDSEKWVETLKDIIRENK